MMEKQKMSSDAIVVWIGYLHKNYPIVGLLLLMMLLDVMVGFCAAFITKTMSSTISYNGMVRKVVMLLLIAVATILDPFAGDIPVSKLTAMFFLVTEGISILENTKRVGVPIPDFLSDVLMKLKTGEKPSVGGQQQNVNIDHVSRVDIRTDIHHNTAPPNTADTPAQEEVK